MKIKIQCKHYLILIHYKYKSRKYNLTNSKTRVENIRMYKRVNVYTFRIYKLKLL